MLLTVEQGRLVNVLKLDELMKTAVAQCSSTSYVGMAYLQVKQIASFLLLKIGQEQSRREIRFISKTKLESNYKRLQRFLSKFELGYGTLFYLVVGLMKIPQPWVLSLERTT